MQEFGQQVLACFVAVLAVQLVLKAFFKPHANGREPSSDLQKIQLQGPNNAGAALQLTVEGMSGLVDSIKSRTDEGALPSTVLDRLSQIDHSIALVRADVDRLRLQSTPSDQDLRRGIWEFRKKHFVRLIMALGRCIDGLILIEPFVDGNSGAGALTDQDRSNFLKAAETLHLATGHLSRIRWGSRFVLGEEIGRIVESLPASALSNKSKPCRATLIDYSTALAKIEAIGRDVLLLDVSSDRTQFENSGRQH